MTKLTHALVLTLGLVSANPIAITATVLPFATLVSADTAKCLSEISCKSPTAVKRGVKAPVWKVKDCVIGPAGGPYKVVDCQSPEAVHTAPTGNQAVCFVGTDGKIHWDYQWAVKVGNRFINRRVNGSWQPDWQN